MSGNPWVEGLDEEAAGERGRAYAARFDRLAARGGDVHGEADLVASLIPAGGRVLDAGCGTGRVAARLAERGYRPTGVDLDAGMLAEARRRHPGLPWLHRDLADLTPHDVGPPFDAVVAAGNVMPLLTAGTEARVVAVLAGLLRPAGGQPSGAGQPSGGVRPADGGQPSGGVRPADGGEPSGGVRPADGEQPSGGLRPADGGQPSGGLLIAGFGLDDAHLPPSVPASALFRSAARYEEQCAAAGLRLQERWAGWDRSAFAPGGGGGGGGSGSGGSDPRTQPAGGPASPAAGYVVYVHERP